MSRVTSEYSGAGDPKRTIELLWRTKEAPKRGPKPRLTVDQIAETAIELADRDGLAALSMRRVAEQLGATAMSLYTYVPSKAELIDLMLDTVNGETARPDQAGHGWRDALERIAKENWALYRRHSWLLQVASGRPTIGPNIVAKYDYELRAIEGFGLTDVEMDLLLSLVLNYVHGAVRTAVEVENAKQRSGMTDRKWWEIQAPLLEKVVDSVQFPIADRVGTSSSIQYDGASDPARSFEFGLQRVLDGIESFINSRS